MALRVALLSCLVLLLSLIGFASMATSEKCTYLVRVQTGDRRDAGTDSKLSLQLRSSTDSFTVDNLEDWGIMDPGHDYFEQGNLDIFSGTGLCLDVCAITVTSDGTKNKPGWYLDDVKVTVTVTGGTSKKLAFPVDQWLALDEFPYHLYATVNFCSSVFKSRPILSSV